MQINPTITIRILPKMAYLTKEQEAMIEQIKTIMVAHGGTIAKTDLISLLFEGRIMSPAVSKPLLRRMVVRGIISQETIDGRIHFRLK